MRGSATRIIPVRPGRAHGNVRGDARMLTADAAALANARADARCPGALHAVQARDGLLVRIRVPGGFLGSDALRALAACAERYADGNIDCTARASIQLRGVRAEALSELGADLFACGLLPSLEHDRVRNIVASPFAGVDPDEIVDARPLVRALDDALVVEATLARLPAKFAFAIDGGGRAFPTSRPDVFMRAIATANGPRMRFTLAGDDGATDVVTDEAPAIALAVARAALAAAEEANEPETWRLATSLAARNAATAVLRAHDGRPEQKRDGDARPRASGAGRAAIPVGTFAERDAGTRTLVPSVPLGRLTSAQARALAGIAIGTGADVRLAWWRGVALTGVPIAHLVAVVISELAKLGLPCDRSDGFVGIAACAGLGGCDAANADVRALASALAEQRRSGHGTGAFTANVAGCGKRCAMRRGASVDLVASVGGTYDLLRNGVIVRSGATPADALAFATHAASLFPERSIAEPV